MSIRVKIINDPVYGFIRFPEPEMMQVIEHPWFQRLRHIKQMGLAQLVYPGAVHTRLAHSLGTAHLMGKALEELEFKGIKPSKEERLAARLAALLHDIGHCPFSHSLEYSIVGLSHERLSQLIMLRMNEEMGGLLETSLSIFSHSYPLTYLRQLVSSQLDVDRMDYLNRDSFYTGVYEGVIGYDRILQMLTVINNELVVEEKGVHSIEKFIIARRLMFWQVYLHKTVLGAEMLLINIFKRAKQLIVQKRELFTTPLLKHFLYNNITDDDFLDKPIHLDKFCQLDDHDIMVSIKEWQKDEDQVLSKLCKMLILRKLYKVVLSSESLAANLIKIKDKLRRELNIAKEDIDYFAFEGITSNNTYKIDEELINIETKSGKIRNITEIDDSLINPSVAGMVRKNYICYVQN